jgi:hypothetical protein
MPIEGKCEMYLNGGLVAGFNAKVPIAFEPSSQFFVDAPLAEPQEVPGFADFMNMARLEPVGCSFTATATTRWSREDADKFFAALEVRLPKPQVRQIGLAIELGGTQPMTVGLPDGRSFNGKCWSKIGTARSGHTQQRLRKFVKRGGKLVEVRARGRTGGRVLQEAVLQAGVEGCFGNEFTVEGTYG